MGAFLITLFKVLFKVFYAPIYLNSNFFLHNDTCIPPYDIGTCLQETAKWQQKHLPSALNIFSSNSDIYLLFNLLTDSQVSKCHWPRKASLGMSDGFYVVSCQHRSHGLGWAVQAWESGNALNFVSLQRSLSEWQRDRVFAYLGDSLSSRLPSQSKLCRVISSLHYTACCPSLYFILQSHADNLKCNRNSTEQTL